MSVREAVKAVEKRDQRERRRTALATIAILLALALSLVLQFLAIRGLNSAVDDVRAVARNQIQRTRALLKEHERDNERIHEQILDALLEIARRSGIDVEDLPPDIQPSDTQKREETSPQDDPRNRPPPNEPPPEEPPDEPPEPICFPPPVGCIDLDMHPLEPGGST